MTEQDQAMPPLSGVTVRLNLRERCFDVIGFSDRATGPVIEAQATTIAQAVEQVLGALVVVVKDHEQIVVQAREDQLAHITDKLGPKLAFLRELANTTEGDTDGS